MKAVSRVLSLDLIRAIAIFTVLLHHIPNQYIGSNLFSEVIWGFIRGGWIGVDLFFVLSGFLVSGIYFREYQKNQTISVKNFIIRRGFKIYPNFYLLILITVLAGFIFNMPIDKTKLFSELFFFQSYVDGFWGPTWSISVEEHFYILLSILFLILFSLPRKTFTENIFRKLPQIFIGLVIITTSIRFWNYLHYTEFSFLKQFGNTHIRIDSLMFGVIISYFYHFKPERIFAFKKYSFLILALCGASLLPYLFIVRGSHSWISFIGLTHIYLVSGLTLICFLNLNIPSNFFTKFFARIGANSYAIYLWHVPVLFWLELNFKTESIGLVIAYLALSIIIGEILTTYFENPVLKLRDKLFPSTSGNFKIKEKTN